MCLTRDGHLCGKIKSSDFVQELLQKEKQLPASHCKPSKEAGFSQGLSLLSWLLLLLASSPEAHPTRVAEMWGEIKTRNPLQKSATLCFRPHLINQQRLHVDLCLMFYC